VHIVGLGYELDDAGLSAGLEQVRGGRDRRAREMADALARVGIQDAYEGAAQYAGNPALISRTHFARYLVETGVCPSTQEVFRHYLTEGKPGFVPHRWATLGEAVGWIRAAGGTAVIAHPGRYKFTPTEEYALFTEFIGHGGRAVEVRDRQPHGGRVREVRRHGAGVRPARLARQRLPRAGREPHRPRRPAWLPGQLRPVWEAIESRVLRP
jgi:predicted metal-dependent phosphoesterase TrpH